MVRLRQRIPALASERLQSAVELFASFFVPFYFFKTGLHLSADDFSWTSLGIGLAFLVSVVPVRIAITTLHRKLSLHEPMRDGIKVGISMVPTLVFTIVLADILRERYGLSQPMYGGLIVYAVLDTTLPGLLLRLFSKRASANETSSVVPSTPQSTS